MGDPKLIPDCRVSVGGQKLELGDDARLTRVNVDLDAEMFSQCEIVFNDPKLELINGKKFESGTAVKVEIGFAAKLVKVFEGEVVALEPRFRRDNPPALAVICADSIHRLALSQMTRSLDDVDDNDVIGKIAQEHGLSGEGPTGTKTHMLQSNVTDAIFLKRIAAKHGNQLRIEGKKLIVGPPPKGEEIAVGPGDGLNKIKVRIKAVQQIGEVTVHGWDPKTAKEIVGKAKPEGEMGEGAKKYGGGKTLSLAGHDHGPEDVATAEKIAKARMAKIAEGYITADFDMVGDPRVIPGANVGLTKMGEQVDGTYRVDKAAHFFSKHGYFVKASAVRVSKKTAASKAQEKAAEAEQAKLQDAAEADAGKREEKRLRDRDRERQGAPKDKGPFAQEETEFNAGVHGESEASESFESGVSGEAHGDTAEAGVSGDAHGDTAEASVSAEEHASAGGDAPAEAKPEEPASAPDGEKKASDGGGEAPQSEPSQSKPEEKQPDAEKKPDEAKTESAPPSVVATLDGVHFEFDKSFALPGAIPTWRGIHAFLKKSPNRRVLVVGHTDKTGEEDYNLALSKERAEMAAAALRGDADTWYKHYEHRDAGKKWGKREDGWMLNKLGFLKKEPKDASADETTAAMRAFQKKNTLQGDGKPSEATRKALIRQYLDLNGSSSNAVNGAQVLGCGERHPKEGASNAELRRVEIFLFDGEIKPEPSKCAKADHPGCTAYDAWLKEKTGDVPPEDVAAGPQSTPEADALEKAQKKVDDLKKKYAPKIVSRADWGARPRKDDPKWVDYPADQPLPLTNIVVHHTSTVHLIGGGLKLTVKELQNFEMDENKYSDMPYHFVIGADGKIYEGREMKSVGAHAGEIDGNTDIKKDPDWGSVGIVLMGDFEGDLVGKDSPTPEELKSLHDLTCHLLLEYEGIKPDKILKHSEVVRSGPPKACPGKRMAPKVDELKASPDLKEIEDALKELRDAKAKANGN